MASLVQLCIVGILFHFTWTEASVVTPPSTPSETKCIHITLKSTVRTNDKKEIRDDNGDIADIISVNVVKKFSNALCRLDDSVVIAEPFVIAKKGCHAQFRVCYRPVKQVPPTARPGCKIVRLLSRQLRETESTLEKRIVSMRVVNQLPTGVTCDQKKNYGFRGNVAYANGGCRADFEVCFRQTPTTGETGCRSVTLKSTKSVPSERRILDSENGWPVTIYGVTLERQLSRAVKCVEWKTFIFNDTHVVAKDGCEGVFKVCYLKAPPPTRSPPQPSGCFTVRLLSTLGNLIRKTITDDGDKIKSITITEQLSGIKCIRNKNFGLIGRDLFVSGGCRAEFRVCLNQPPQTTPRSQSECVNVDLASWGTREPDSTKITARDGSSVQIKTVRLVKEVSNKACFDYRTFYIRGADEVVATNGCRGTFRVCYV